MLSMITPPIALAAFAAASIAQASQLGTGYQAFRFGWIAYVLPFLFIYKPALLLQGSILEIGYVLVSSVVALVLVVGGAVGYTRGPLGLLMRVVWVLTGLLTIAPLQAIGPAYIEYGVSAFGLLLVAAGLLRPKAGQAMAHSQDQNRLPGGVD